MGARRCDLFSIWFSKKSSERMPTKIIGRNLVRDKSGDNLLTMRMTLQWLGQHEERRSHCRTCVDTFKSRGQSLPCRAKVRDHENTARGLAVVLLQTFVASPFHPRTQRPGGSRRLAGCAPRIAGGGGGRGGK